MYAALWRILPGPRWLKVVQALVLVGVVLAFCFLWLFPRISQYMPFSDNTVSMSSGSRSTVSMSTGSKPTASMAHTVGQSVILRRSV